jgi:hypothetical protein
VSVSTEHPEFDPRGAAAFVFLDADYVDGVARFRYQFSGGAVLCERVRFPGAPTVSAERAVAFSRCLQLAHFIIGISYYKAGVPPRIECSHPPDAQLGSLLDTLYLNGLGEFAHVNQLDLSERIVFPRGAELHGPAATLGLPQRALAAIGGGKDSLVTIEDLKSAMVPTCVTWVGHSELIRATATATGLPTLNLERQIDPQLFEYNRAGAWNGHIPVTAINSSLLLLAALLYGYDRVVFSNEASADSPNLTHADGFAVNHQWSKGALFENLLHDYVHTAIAADLRYYSHLRGASELDVIRRFAGLTSYHSIFSSCNRNFKLLGERPESRWCGQCPKCLFVFLGLAPYLAKPALTAIFGRNLLDDPTLQAGFEALLELGGRHKPFECVGEVGEARAALRLLSVRADWAEDSLVRDLSRAI